MNITIDFTKNNLENSLSPYLKQHAQNPVHWQEWSTPVLEYAKTHDIPLFVSVGYATCHWCHVMAADAFSDSQTANFINDHFIAIKVDRETRPDIDQILMDFMLSQHGSGGWPLNVFLTSGLRPVAALTYAGSTSKNGIPTLLDYAASVLHFIKEKNELLPPLESQPPRKVSKSFEGILQVISAHFDPLYGGFGTTNKFPPHATLLFLLNVFAVTKAPEIGDMCIKTLDAIRLKGLYDHLAGGIFRYCVDQKWTIPHFEKMLYDQAMALWYFSLAAKIFDSREYEHVAQGIVKNLFETFAKDGLFVSAFDADTHHHEGATYLWSYAELSSCLTQVELESLCKVYDVSEHGNFEGLVHLVKYADVNLPIIQEKLLAIRRLRIQPGVDTKILCNVNALAVVGLIVYSRLIGDTVIRKKALEVLSALVDTFVTTTSVAHVVMGNETPKYAFLSDAASLLLAVTYAAEDDPLWLTHIPQLRASVLTFFTGVGWVEAHEPDFIKVYASETDHPMPSGYALACMALLRSDTLLGTHGNADHFFKEYQHPLGSDFSNLGVFFQEGFWHIITSSTPLDTKKVPINSIVVKGTPDQDCYAGVCSPVTSSWYCV